VTVRLKEEDAVEMEWVGDDVALRALSGLFLTKSLGGGTCSCCSVAMAFAVLAEGVGESCCLEGSLRWFYDGILEGVHARGR